MSCSCSAVYEECDERSDVWREGRRITRKQHRCYECCKEIPVGSQVCFASSLYDGKWETWYRCPTCSVYAEYLATAVNECPLWGHLTEYVDDCGIGDVVLTYERFVSGKALDKEWK